MIARQQWFLLTIIGSLIGYLPADSTINRDIQDVFKNRKPTFGEGNKIQDRTDNPFTFDVVPPMEGILTRSHLLEKDRERELAEQRKKLIQDLKNEGLVMKPSGSGTAPAPASVAPTAAAAAPYQAPTTAPRSSSVGQQTLESAIDEDLQATFSDPDLNKKKISLSTPPMATKKLLGTVAKLSGMNLIIDQDITGKFGALRVKNKTVGEVLRTIANGNKPKLAVMKDAGDIWKILPRSEAVASIKSTHGGKRVSKIIPIKHAKMDDKFKKLVHHTWTSVNEGLNADGTFLHIDDTEKNVVVRGHPTTVQELYKFLFQIDKPIVQVRIDAILVFVDKNYNFDFGIDWSGIYNRQETRERQNSVGFWGLGGRSTDFPTPTTSTVDNNSDLLVNPNNFAVNLFSAVTGLLRSGSIAADAAAVVQIPFVWGGPDLNLKRLTAALNAAEIEGRVKIISRPSILTSNHETAKLLIGESLPLQTAIEDIVQGQSRNITTINFKDIGIVMEVTPVINLEDQTVMLDMFIQDSQVISGSTKANDRGVMEDPPVIEVIKAENKVTLKSSQTTVIGGLSSTREDTASNRMPFFSKLPVLGKYLFSSEFDFNRHRERFIFITPTIIAQEV